jgi:hypothetical protein
MPSIMSQIYRRSIGSSSILKCLLWYVVVSGPYICSGAKSSIKGSIMGEQKVEQLILAVDPLSTYIDPLLTHI